MYKFLLIIILFCSVGCKVNPKNTAMAMLPLNIAASWFGNVAIHEGGHVFAARTLRAERIKYSILPGQYNGDFHFGFTEATYSYDLSPSQASYFLASGTGATFLSHVTFGEINRTGYISEYLQPTLQWMDFGGMISTYSQSIYGLARMRQTDLGRESAWIAGAFLSAQVIYDVIRIGFSPGGYTKYFNVLIGHDFY